MTDDTSDSGLQAWGWNDGWADAAREVKNALQGAGDIPGPVEPARVVGQDRDRWTLQTAAGRRTGRIPTAGRVPTLPAVGDWVLAVPGPEAEDPLSIRAVLPRRSAFRRGAAGKRVEEQTVAANVDRVWIVHGLDVEPREAKLERYLAVAWESGASPEIVLTKADLAADLDAATARVEAVAFGVPVRRVSVVDGTGLEGLAGSLQPGTTVALLGPSGVGKSSLINGLANQDLVATGAVRSGDHKGRHTTVRRELIRIPGGALLLDTPGMRELQVWALDEGLGRAFPEIDELAAGCRFRDCAHESEPGCAVHAAVAAGTLPGERLESYRKLQAEAAYLARKTDPLARTEAVSEYKSIMKSMKHHPKYRKS